jgi:hypothetical protein
MFKNNFVVALRCNGKILKEQGDSVILPFGSEYTIYMKNIEARDCVVKIWIDGEDVVGSNRIIVRANNTAELKGFKNGNKVRDKFKFIKKTQEISDYRGDRIDDGLIRVEVTYTQKVETTYKKNYVFNEWNQRNWSLRDWPTWYYNSSDITWYVPKETTVYASVGSGGGGGGSPYGASNSSEVTYTTNCGFYNQEIGENLNKLCSDGITVKGSDTKQDFTGAYIDTLESTSHIIILKLKGIDESGIEIKKPVFVRDKLKCEVCGRNMKSSSKFCSNCGAKL